MKKFAPDLPAFARTSAGRRAYAQGWKQRAEQWRMEARGHGLTLEQRRALLANAQAADSQAALWTRMDHGMRRAAS
jgi:hypothetical protein